MLLGSVVLVAVASVLVIGVLLLPVGVVPALVPLR